LVGDGREISGHRATGAPTATDVAKIAGVSRQTVANVLHAPHRVRDETRRHVERVIAELGYRPNRAAQALKLNASRTVGYRIEPVARGALASIHDRFLHALAEAGSQADLHFLVYTAESAAGEIAAAQRLRGSGSADAFVLYDIAADDPRPAAFLDLEIPFVTFGHTGGDTDGRHPWVDVDNEAGVGMVVDHLVQQGHRRIAFLGWPSGSTIGDRRAGGWQAAVERHGLATARGTFDARCEDTAAAAAERAYGLLGLAEPPTAFVAATDTLAVGVLRGCQRRGVEPGRDVAVVGFDDTPTAAALELSSVRQPIESVGRQLIAALFDGPGDGGRLLPPHLVIRASSSAPHRS
jgi:DNA-binding LacI/PurR family transcriptional regulator